MSSTLAAPVDRSGVFNRIANFNKAPGSAFDMAVNQPSKMLEDPPFMK